MDNVSDPAALAAELGLPLAEHPPGCDGLGKINHADRTVARCPGCADANVMRGIAVLIPRRHRKPVKLPAEVAAWVERGLDADGLYLTGPLGAGKTCMAYAAAARWCLATGTVPTAGGWSGDDRWTGPTVEPVRATALFDELRPGADGVRRRIVDLQRAKLLILDDVGAEKPSEWTVEKLYEIVDERYAQTRPLIVTSNVPPAQLTPHVGARVASRFAEICDVVALTGPDLRRAS